LKISVEKGRRRGAERNISGKELKSKVTTTALI
jgi:hypothetical protein